MLEKIQAAFKKHHATLFGVTEIKDGIVTSCYPVEASACHNSYSVAKAFTVTAIGMLVDENKLSVDEKVYDILKPYFPEAYDMKWESVTVHHLLLHRFGLDRAFLDIDTEDPNSYGTKDYLRYVFSHDLPLPIDRERTYSDAAYYVLSRVVAERSGEDLFTYLRTRLFNPLDFEEVAWSTCPQGYAIGATGLYIRTPDMAKLGLVYLNDGVYNGKRILSKEWVDTVLSRGYELKRQATTVREGYCKGGMYGQMLYISKSENTVLAWHAHNREGINKKVLAELELS